MKPPLLGSGLEGAMLAVQAASAASSAARRGLPLRLDAYSNANSSSPAQEPDTGPDTNSDAPDAVGALPTLAGAWRPGHARLAKRASEVVQPLVTASDRRRPPLLEPQRPTAPPRLASHGPRPRAGINSPQRQSPAMLEVVATIANDQGGHGHAAGLPSDGGAAPPAPSLGNVKAVDPTELKFCCAAKSADASTDVDVGAGAASRASMSSSPSASLSSECMGQEVPCAAVVPFPVSQVARRFAVHQPCIAPLDGSFAHGVCVPKPAVACNPSLVSHAEMSRLQILGAEQEPEIDERTAIPLADSGSSGVLTNLCAGGKLRVDERSHDTDGAEAVFLHQASKDSQPRRPICGSVDATEASEVADAPRANFKVLDAKDLPAGTIALQWGAEDDAHLAVSRIEVQVWRTDLQRVLVALRANRTSVKRNRFGSDEVLSFKLDSASFADGNKKGSGELAPALFSRRVLPAHVGGAGLSPAIVTVAGLCPLMGQALAVRARLHKRSSKVGFWGPALILVFVRIGSDVEGVEAAERVLQSALPSGAGDGGSQLKDVRISIDVCKPFAVEDPALVCSSSGNHTRID